MSCSSCSSASSAAQLLKTQTPEELWKASLQHKDPPKADDPSKIDLSNAPQVQAAVAPGTGLVVDIRA